MTKSTSTIELHLAASEGLPPQAAPVLADSYRETVEWLLARLEGSTASAAPPPPVDLARAAVRFGLTDFERDLLALCVAVEIDGRVAMAVTAAGGHANGLPTFGLAFDRIPEAHWDALSPTRPLRRWDLVRIGEQVPVTTAALSVDDAVLMALTAAPCLDPRLAGIVSLGAPPISLPASYLDVAADIAKLLDTSTSVTLVGGDREDMRLVVSHVAQSRGEVPLHVVVPPVEGAMLASICRLVERSSALLESLPVIETSTREVDLAQWTDELSVTHVVLTTGTAPTSRLTRSLGVPSPDEQPGVWRSGFGADVANGLGAHLLEVAATFRVTVAEAQLVASDVRSLEEHERPAALWHHTRQQLRAPTASLAVRVEPRAAWDDLVLADEPLESLRELARHARHQGLVRDSWGADRGTGITALFAGESGTGKSLAAEVIAGDLALDLYRVDLAHTVSKYIGETEKNLARIFDVAERSAAVLLFDEADALFGKRSDVKDSRDRYANLEVAYLLARMESYAGIAILTTNMASTIDRAFLRRLRFVVTFPFPDVATRERLWARAFPATIAVEELDVPRLARLQVSGGAIRSIAIAAAILAADRGTPVSTEHVMTAARREYQKDGRVLTRSELGGRG